MPSVAEQLEAIEERTLSGLKDFQKATVERIDYLFRKGQRRILVSDEVGLGKTLIARGTVAKTAILRREEGDNLVKVVYVCSNAAIADQNLRKLRITSEARTESAGSSRLSMQHLNLFNQENDAALLNSFIQLIPLTPDTSFRITAGSGMVQERALMFAHLRRLPELRNYQKELETAMIGYASVAWTGWCKSYYENAAVACDNRSGGQYFRYIQDKLHQELGRTWHDDITYMAGLILMCMAIRKNDGKRSNIDDSIIGQLRVIFAKISLEKLEPDLVIMDEFQRFKYLISSDPQSETGIPFEKDVWEEMFAEAARREKTVGSSDLIPYWGLRESEDMLKIERIVPMYPFSRDGLAYERLIRILSLYRLTLGQARQEELLEYLFKNCEDPDRLKELFINLSPFYREHRRLEEQSISFIETT